MVFVDVKFGKTVEIIHFKSVMQRTISGLYVYESLGDAVMS